MPVNLAGRLLLVREHSFGTTKIDDQIALFEASDYPVDEFTDPILVLVENRLTFSFPHPLDYNLLRCLRGYAGEVAGIHLHPDGVADLYLGIFHPGFLKAYFLVRILNLFDYGHKLEQFNLSDILVIMSLKVTGIAVFLVSRRQNCLFEGLENYSLVNGLFLDNLIDGMFEVEVRFHGPVSFGSNINIVFV